MPMLAVSKPSDILGAGCIYQELSTRVVLVSEIDRVLWCCLYLMPIVVSELIGFH